MSTTRRKFLSTTGLAASAFTAIGGLPQPDEPAKIITETRLSIPDYFVMADGTIMDNSYRSFAIVCLTIRRVKTYACSDLECDLEPHMHERIEWAKATIGPVVLDRWIEQKTGDKVQQAIDKLVERVVRENLFSKIYMTSTNLGTIPIE